MCGAPLGSTTYPLTTVDLLSGETKREGDWVRPQQPASGRAQAGRTGHSENRHGLWALVPSSPTLWFQPEECPETPRG